jgi:hypothetical protein
MREPKFILVALVLGGTVLAVATGLTMPTSATREQAVTLSGEDKVFLRAGPAAPGAKSPALVPHASPEQAAAIAAAFLAEPWPTEAELAAIAPFEGTENVAAQDCQTYLPKVVTEELSLAPGSIERRMKGEIYALLTVQQVLETGSCTCRGKTPPWEPVPLILNEIISRNGKLSGNLAYKYGDETRRLQRTVERVCEGRL